MPAPRRRAPAARTAASLGPSFATPTSGLIDAAALHLVVVLADDPLLAGDVERAEDASAASSRVVGSCDVGSGLRLDGRRLVDAPRAPPAAGRRAGTPSPGRPTCRAVVLQLQPAGRHEPADDRASTPSLAQSVAKLGHLSWRHGEDHPLLGLGDPDLGVRQALVLQRRSCRATPRRRSPRPSRRRRSKSRRRRSRSPR